MGEQKKNTGGKRPSTASKTTTRTGGVKKESAPAADGIINSTVFKVLIVVAALLLVVAAWRNRTDLSCANISQCAKDASAMSGSGEGFPATITGSTSISIDGLGSGVALLTDTNLTVYNSSAREAASRAHYMSSPAMKTSGRYAILVDIGSTDYRIETISATKTTGDVSRPLISGAVSRNGYYALVMQGSDVNNSYLSSVEVYSPEGELVHKWHGAHYYVTDAALSPDGKYLALCGVNASEGDLVSTISVQRVGIKDSEYKHERHDNIYLSLEYSNTGVLFAVGTNAAAVISGSGESCEYIEIEGNLLGFDVSEDTGLALCIEDGADQSKTQVTLYDTRGQKRFDYTASVRVRAVSLGDEGCCIAGNGQLIALRLDGAVMGQWSATATGGLYMTGYDAYAADDIYVNHIELNE